MFSEDLITEIQDMRYLMWSRTRKSSGTAGSYLKAYGEEDGRKIYYKLSCFDPAEGITGHECVNELIVDRLLTLLGIDHLHYQLIHALVAVDGNDYETWICASEDFKGNGDSKIALDDYYDMKKEPGETAFDFCRRMGWGDYVNQMLAIDYLILNRDRHGANIEIVKNPQTGTIRPAPLFDHGLSLVFNCRSQDDLSSFDVLEDKPVQCFVGGRSAEKNIRLIRTEERPVLRRLDEMDRKRIFEGLEAALPEGFLEKIWKMVTEREKRYEGL